MAPHFTTPSTWVPLSVSAVPVVVTFASLSHARSPTVHHRCHQDSRLGSHHGIPVKAAPVPPRSQLAVALTSSGTSLTSTSTPSLQPQVSTTQVGTHSARSSPAHTRSAGTAQAGTHFATGADPRAGRGPFPQPRACSPAHGQFWTDQICWTRPHSQCGQ